MNNLAVKAKIYQFKDSRTSIKAFANVSIGDILFIGSITVSNTMEHPDRIDVFMPSYRLRNGNYVPHISFNNIGHNKLWAAIRAACLDAYQRFSADRSQLHMYGKPFNVKIEDLLVSNNEDTLTVVNTVFGEYEGLTNDDSPIDLNKISF